MLALCVESSHSKGMGHLFRILHFIEFLKDMSVPHIVLVNNDQIACSILKKNDIKFETVDLQDTESCWEKSIIDKYRVDIWINDRLDTDIKHAQYIKKAGIKLVTFDDAGSGSELSDINFAALTFDRTKGLRGARVFYGSDYLILNKDIALYKRKRLSSEKIIVTLGGSDTYGVTVKVVKILKKLHKKATVLIGPSFRHREELTAETNDDFNVLAAVPSLSKLLYEYDLAVTGGGVTPFEANAAGLPCIVIANEPFEIKNCEFLEGLGSSVFAGYHKDIRTEAFKRDLDIEKMSMAGIDSITLNGAENVYREIRAL